MLSKVFFVVISFIFFLFVKNGVGQEMLFETQIVKFNLLPLAIGSYGVSYETSITDRWSLSINANLRPMNGIPRQHDIERYYTDRDLRVSNIHISQHSITPELRYYFHSSSALRGFYLATFLQYATFDVRMNIDYTGRGNGTNPSLFDFNGYIHTYTVGGSLGRQWRFGKSAYLDWTIIGPGIGVNNGHIKGTNSNDRPLDDYEQQVFVNKPNEFNIPLIDLEIQASEREIDIYTKKLWATMRMLVSIGYRF